MANTNVPRGLTPTRYRSGAMYNGSANLYYVPATNSNAMFIGDPVIVVTASGDANGVPTVTHASAGGGAYITGSVVGFVAAGDPPITKTRDMGVYRAASVAMYVMVADDPDLLFEVQADAALAITASSRNADIIYTTGAGTGNTNSGWSQVMISASSLQTTNTLQTRILRPVERSDNDVATVGGLYTKWLVSINLHSARNLTGV